LRPALRSVWIPCGSARACLIKLHLTEGNQGEALRQFERFSHVLQAELGLAPTPQLRKLVEPLL
jgi:SARP family transcriptional regulator, regulator of embCAB operon